MSHTVVRGEPEPAQVYFDTLLDEVLADLQTSKDANITSREQVTFTQLIYHRFKKHPDSIYMVNGATDEEITNKELKDNAIRIARALTTRNAKGKIAVCAMKKDENIVKMYYGLLFAGVVPFMVDVMISELLEHYLKLLDPAYIFYDSDRHEALTAALRTTGVTPEMVQVDKPEIFANFFRGHDGDCDNFQLASVSVDDTMVMLSTSGSTGVPKLAPLTHRGILAQLPIHWLHLTEFPPVNQKMLNLSTVEWMSFHLSLFSFPIYNTPVLMSPKSVTMDHIKELIEKHRPTGLTILPAFGTVLLNTMTAEALTQFKLFLVGGAVISDDFFTAIARMPLPHPPTEPQLTLTMSLMKDKDSTTKQMVRGEPEPAQVYFDTLLDEVLADLQTNNLDDTITSREQVTLTQLMYHRFKKHPDSVYMINGATDQEITNKELKDNAIRIARALTTRNAKGKIAVCAMKKDENIVKMYYGILFAGVVPFMVDVMISELLEHYLKLLNPAYIFYDSDRHEALTAALRTTGVTPEMVQVDKPEIFANFFRGHDGDCDNFQLASVSVDDTMVMLSTSGSTGVPKLAPLTHRGILAQLPIHWLHLTEFPPVNQKMLNLSTVEWMSFHLSLFSFPIYNTPVLMSPKSVTMDHIKELIEKHRPTGLTILPAFGTVLLNTMTAEALTQFKLFLVGGAVISDDFFTAIAEKLPKSATVVDMFGTTETTGIIAAHTRNPAAPCRILKILNIVDYKIVDSKGQKVGLDETGELLVKGVSTIKSYYKNEDAYKENFSPDGWYKTGDLFHSHGNEMITFVGRKKFAHDLEGGLMLYPEEVERIVCLVPGVAAGAVHMTSAGPAAAVVPLPGLTVSRELVKQAVDSCLDIHKRLHGGVAFVPSLPLTRNGKINRRECNKMIEQLVQNGQCF